MLVEISFYEYLIFALALVAIPVAQMSVKGCAVSWTLMNCFSRINSIKRILRACLPYETTRIW
jgi:hypothetical protein